jgi:hypothetical protein
MQIIGRCEHFIGILCFCMHKSHLGQVMTHAVEAFHTDWGPTLHGYAALQLRPSRYTSRGHNATADFIGLKSETSNYLAATHILHAQLTKSWSKLL